MGYYVCWVCSNSLLVDKLEMPLTIGPNANTYISLVQRKSWYYIHTCTLAIWSFDFRTWPRKGNSLSSYKCIVCMYSTTYIANSGGLGCFFLLLSFSFFSFFPHLRNVEKPALGKYSIWRTSESKEIRQPGRENHGLGAGGKGDTDATVFIFPAARNQSWNACMHRCKLELLVSWPDDYYKHTFSYAVTAYISGLCTNGVVDEVSRSEKFKKKKKFLPTTYICTEYVFVQYMCNSMRKKILINKCFGCN